MTTPATHPRHTPATPSTVVAGGTPATPATPALYGRGGGGGRGGPPTPAKGARREAFETSPQAPSAPRSGPSFSAATGAARGGHRPAAWLPGGAPGPQGERWTPPAIRNVEGFRFRDRRALSRVRPQIAIGKSRKEKR